MSPELLEAARRGEHFPMPLLRQLFAEPECVRLLARNGRLQGSPLSYLTILCLRRSMALPDESSGAAVEALARLAARGVLCCRLPLIIPRLLHRIGFLDGFAPWHCALNARKAVRIILAAPSLAEALLVDIDRRIVYDLHHRGALRVPVALHRSATPAVWLAMLGHHRSPPVVRAIWGLPAAQADAAVRAALRGG